MSSSRPSSDRAATLRSDEARNAREIEAALARLLDPVLSSRRTASAAAAALAALAPDQQNFVLRWVVVIARTNIELAFQFAVAAPNALVRMNPGAAEGWVVECMDTYDREGLHRATEVLRDPSKYLSRATDRSAVELENVSPVLRLFVRALGGRPLNIEAAPASYTDSETIYLPARIARGANAEDNFLLYKASVALMWAQTRYGTLTTDVSAACAAFPEPRRALELFNALETLRLEARLAATLPALARRMAALRGDTHVDPRCARLLHPGATVEDTLQLMRELYEAPPALPDRFGVVLKPELAAAVRDARIARERNELIEALAQLLRSHEAPGQQNGDARIRVSTEQGAGSEFVVHLDDETIAVPPEVAQLFDSIVQDLGEVPDEYLALGEHAQHAAPGDGTAVRAGGDMMQTPAFHYDEWDHVRGHYRKAWCTLRELEVEPGDAEFVARTQSRYAAKIAQLRRTFELMRGEDRVLKRQPDGDSIDLDALIESYADMRAGAELPPLLFTKRRKHERDLAVMIMVDMSGSTKGWVNEAEREALVLLCEALEALGDRYAIYGFSGVTRRRCEIYRVKRFEEPYDAAVRERIAGIEPQDYTRMGAPIRHLTMRLNQIQARTKLLITLSDGKPDDYSDAYRGDYGVEDTRRALIEAHRAGVKPFCVTIDREARDYLPHMYGAANWTLIDDVSRLPLKIADVYRRLTA